MTEEFYILKIVQEDILRILAEEEKSISFAFIKTKIKVSSSFALEAIKELEKEKLIEIEKNFIQLTKNGQKKSEDILRKHLILENYFKRTSDEEAAHKKAEIIEHYISEEVIKNIKKLRTLKKTGIPLTKFKLHKEGLIADIDISDNGLFERVVSMGVFPGKKIRIINQTLDRIIVKIRNKKFVLDNSIAKNIKVLDYKNLTS